MPGASRNLRGNSSDRRRRRELLVEQYGVENASGKKTRIPCFHCGKKMKSDGKQWQVDRYPLCGHVGGRYVKGNVVPSCASCNGSRCGNQHRECSTGPKKQGNIARRGENSCPTFVRGVYTRSLNVVDTDEKDVMLDAA